MITLTQEARLRITDRSLLLCAGQKNTLKEKHRWVKNARPDHGALQPRYSDHGLQLQQRKAAILLVDQLLCVVILGKHLSATPLKASEMNHTVMLKQFKPHTSIK